MLAVTFGDENKAILDRTASANITQLRVPIKMEQSVYHYLDNIVMEDVPKPYNIDGRPSKNILLT